MNAVEQEETDLIDIDAEVEDLIDIQIEEGFFDKSNKNNVDVDIYDRCMCLGKSYNNSSDFIMLAFALSVPRTVTKIH